MDLNLISANRVASLVNWVKAETCETSAANTIRAITAVVVTLKTAGIAIILGSGIQIFTFFYSNEDQISTNRNAGF